MKAKPPYPQYADPMKKFQRGTVCGPGVPVEDTATLFSGEPCCSSCRRRMTLNAEEVWVHA